MATGTKRKLSKDQSENILGLLESRFEKNINLHKDIQWYEVKAKLEANPEKLWSINEMEKTGGQPDVAGYDKKTGEYIFYDCSAETPEGRRNTCYDKEGQMSREKKDIYPAGNAIELAIRLMLAW